MTKIGKLWKQGKVGVGAEHFATGVIRTLLGEGLRQTQNFGSDAVAIFATPEGELHELGVLTAAIIAQSAGVRSLYLGPQLPAESTIRAARNTGARIVCLGSAALPEAELAERVSEIVPALPPGVDLWLGGTAFSDFPDKPYGRVSVFRDTADFLDAARRFRCRAARRHP